MPMTLETTHTVFMENSSGMRFLERESVDLVVTSPPYPMISMWDDTFSSMNPEIGLSLEAGDGMRAFDLMHAELDRVWNAVGEVLRDGGLVCINIGDATRKVGDSFCMYPSHSRIIKSFSGMGFRSLPGILWRKPSNSPNKFMGSGMLPAGAYVTLEHEHILIFRKGRKREFKSEADKEARRESSYFWEERNAWFSDVWQDLPGVRQVMQSPGRGRSGAFPLDLPLRLLNMFSIRGDTVVDPFLGTGTTSLAAILTGRNSTGYELDTGLMEVIDDLMGTAVKLSGTYVSDRIRKHAQFVSDHLESGGSFNHYNEFISSPVKDRSERFLKMARVQGIEKTGTSPLIYRAIYSDLSPDSGVTGSPEDRQTSG